MNSEMPKVILIVGMARSGSTLLSMLLGQMSAMLNAGEIMHLWDRGIARDDTCGCGERMSTCSYWQEVFAGHDWGERADAAQWHRKLDAAQAKHALRSTFLPGKPQDYDEAARALREALHSMLSAGSADYVIDSSKRPSYARFLSKVIGRENLHIVHIVRDPRGVAFSGAKTRAKTDAGQQGVMMVRRSPAKTAMAWNRMQISARMLQPLAATYQTLRYEDLCRVGPAALLPVLERIGSDLPGKFEREVIANEVGEPAPQHTVSGNPMRLGGKGLQISLDEKWRSALPARDRSTVTALCAPLMALTGYPIR